MNFSRLTTARNMFTGVAVEHLVSACPEPRPAQPAASCCQSAHDQVSLSLPQGKSSRLQGETAMLVGWPDSRVCTDHCRIAAPGAKAARSCDRRGEVAVLHRNRLACCTRAQWFPRDPGLRAMGQRAKQPHKGIHVVAASHCRKAGLRL